MQKVTFRSPSELYAEYVEGSYHVYLSGYSMFTAQPKLLEIARIRSDVESEEASLLAINKAQEHLYKIGW